MFAPAASAIRASNELVQARKRNVREARISASWIEALACGMQCPHEAQAKPSAPKQALNEATARFDIAIKESKRLASGLSILLGDTQSEPPALDDTLIVQAKQAQGLAVAQQPQPEVLPLMATEG